MQLPNAEDVNYWKTGATQPDTLLDRASKQIEDVGGEVTERASVMLRGNAAIILAFTIGDDSFRIAWPVLVTSRGERDTPAARRQAASFVAHDVKAKCMIAKVIGGRAAFAGNLLTSAGRTVAELTNPELESAMPKLLESR